MISWNKRTAFTLASVALAAAALSACGHRPHEGKSGQEASRGASFLVERVAGRLDLNEDQKVRLRTLADKVQVQSAAFKTVGGDPRTELQALVAGEKFDRTRAQKLVAEKTAALATGSPDVITALADFYDSLNPTQQAKVRQFMDRRRGDWRRG